MITGVWVCTVSGQVLKNGQSGFSPQSHCGKKKIDSGLSLTLTPVWSMLHSSVQCNVNICLALCVKDMKF